ncbi:sterol desaturase family protein [Rhodoplanes sp. Z2-YC6860]|uniref:sterol desaturase family protein n=1 Tax=Rhodoplanes sp. Z2-YC6860 TaxID=674703 RepID=UPI00078E2FFF|nr:sterol desaturase family protein [Rhodoplanes sp. Z2-YC6860]AMN43691.1 fatty acid hydroxylase [Rhodoplanes sp. Z2-YC6860]
MDFFGLTTILLACLIFVPLERLCALRPNQRIFRHGWHTDIVYLLLNGSLIKLGLLGIVFVVAFIAAHAVPVPFREWVGGQPYWLQLAEAVILADIGFYWTHRMFHAVPWLWRFHAIHHSIEELDWLAAWRVHPVDQILTKGVSLIPVLALGFSDVTIGLYRLLYQWQSVFIHANVRIGLGPMRWLFASPEFHHWHHSADLEARDKNFAGQLSFLDALFGSLHMPRGKMPTSYGTDQPLPKHYFPQLFYPFRSIPYRTPDSTEEQPNFNGSNESSRPLSKQSAAM